MVGAIFHHRKPRQPLPPLSLSWVSNTAPACLANLSAALCLVRPLTSCPLPQLLSPIPSQSFQLHLCVCIANDKSLAIFLFLPPPTHIFPIEGFFVESRSPDISTSLLLMQVATGYNQRQTPANSFPESWKEGLLLVLGKLNPFLSLKSWCLYCFENLPVQQWDRSHVHVHCEQANVFK